MNYYKNIVSQILKMTSDGFIITDTEGNVREINKQYADFFGKSRSEIIGKSILNIIPNSKMIDIVKLLRIAAGSIDGIGESDDIGHIFCKLIQFFLWYI